NRLSCLIQEQFHLDPFKPHILFMFCGKRADRIKCLLWEEDGFLLLYKRLEAGRFQWPRTESDVLSITPEQFQWLMQGLAIEQKKVIPKVTPTRSL
uniref:IS66 family insertion sequence element accessory protein TnpB n=1 Tax=Cellulosilyticum ruminicola TaxID=425254 RepID=UPI0006CF37A0